MRFLVTGITGMLGTSLSRRILAKGHELYGLSRGRKIRPPFEGEKRFEADITDSREIGKIIGSLRPDAVIHPAAISDVDYCERHAEEAHQVNGEGTRFLAEVSRQQNVPFCYISTDYVFEGERPQPYREEDPCRPVNVYGKSKLEGEMHSRKYPRHWIIRTSWLFGEGHDSFVHHVLGWSKTKKEISLVEDKWSIPTYTPDLANAIYSLFEKEIPPGVYHIASGGGGCSWLEYGREILALGGAGHIPLRPISLGTLGLAAKRPLRTVLNCDKFSRVLGSSLRPWREALRDYLNEQHLIHSNRPQGAS